MPDIDDSRAVWLADDPSASTEKEGLPLALKKCSAIAKTC